MLVVVVQSGFPHRHDYGVRQGVAEAIGGAVPPLRSDVRVHTRRGRLTQVAGQRDRTSRPLLRVGYDHHMAHAGRFGAREHFPPVRVESRIAEVAMRVD
jgi:hypothetical protein